MYGFNHRYHESVKEAKKNIDNGKYGKIVFLRTGRCFITFSETLLDMDLIFGSFTDCFFISKELILSVITFGLLVFNITVSIIFVAGAIMVILGCFWLKRKNEKNNPNKAQPKKEEQNASQSQLNILNEAYI